MPKAVRPRPSLRNRPRSRVSTNDHSSPLSDRVFSTWRSLASRFYRNGETKIVDLADLGVVEIALHPPGKDIWLSDVLRQGHLIEHHITLLLSEFLRPGATFLDIGANFGWFSVIGSRLAGESG